MSQGDFVSGSSKTDDEDMPVVFGGTGFQPVKEFKIYRRNLPHLEQPGSLYFITFRTAKDIVLKEDAKDIVFNSIKFHGDKKYLIYACVIMPDHVHLILKPLEKTKDAFYSLAEILHSVKSYSSNKINKLFSSTGILPVEPEAQKIWLDESFDRILRSANELQEKMNYIINNPVKSALVGRPEDYRWLYIPGLFND